MSALALVDALLWNVYSDLFFREQFSVEGIPEPSAGIIDRCRYAAKQASMALPNDIGDKEFIKVLDDALVNSIKHEADEYKKEWNKW